MSMLKPDGAVRRLAARHRVKNYGAEMIPGPPGKNGRDGKDGRHGTNGKDGKNGRDGKDGAPGKDMTPEFNYLAGELRALKVQVVALTEQLQKRHQPRLTRAEKERAREADREARRAGKDELAKAVGG